MTITTTEKISDTLHEMFPFQVLKLPLNGPDGLRSPEYGLWRDDNGEYCSSRSVRGSYVPHQTSDVITLAEAGATAFNDEIQISGTFRDGHHISLQPTKKFRQSIFGSSDNIFPRFSDACRNMMELKSVESTSIMIRHDSNLRANMDGLIADFATLRNRWDSIVEAVRGMESRKVQLTEFISKLIPIDEQDSAITKGRAEKKIAKIFTRIQKERWATGRPEIGSDWMVSAWEAFNGVQGFVQHDKSRAKGSTDYDRVIAASSDSLVKQAELLAISA
jgi:hypothetical protein